MRKVMGPFMLLFMMVGLLVSCGWQQKAQSKNIKGEIRSGFLTKEQQGCVVGDDGILLIYKGDSKWKSKIGDSPDVHSHYHLNTVERLTDTIWITCGVGGRFFVTRDSGESWILSGMPFNDDNKANCRYTSFIGPEYGWVSTGRVLAATTDLGETWKTIPMPPQADTVMAVCCTSPDNGFIVDRDMVLYRTTDGGGSWLRIGVVEDPKTPLTGNPYSEQNQVLSLRAVGNTFILAYSCKTGEIGQLVIRESDDKGQSWKTTGKIRSDAGTVSLSREGQVSLTVPGKTLTLYDKP